MSNKNFDGAPKATDALLARIEASRAAGARVILPDAGDDDLAELVGKTEQTNSTFVLLPLNRNRQKAWGVGIAAAAILGFTIQSWDVNGTASGSARRGDNDSVSKSSVADAVADVFSPLPTVAYAQAAPGADGQFDALLNVNGAALKAGTWTYLYNTITDGTFARAARVAVVSLAEVQFEARPAWRLIENVVSKDVGADTLWIDRLTLRPLARHSHMVPFTMMQKFNGNEVESFIHHVKLNSDSKEYTRKTNGSMEETGSVIVTSAHLRLALRTQKLHAKWRGSFGSGYGSPIGAVDHKPSRIVLRVAGSETVKINGHREECWRVEFARSRAQVWFVSKRTGEVVRTDFRPSGEYAMVGELFTSPQ